MTGERGFPRRMRLHLNREFQRVYQTGKRRHGEGFSLIFAPNGLDFRRLGLSVRRKVGTAARRNRVKRLFRECFRLHRERFPEACDIVVAVRPEFACDSLAAVTDAVAAALAPRSKPA